MEIDPPVASDSLANAVQCARFARAVRVSGCLGPKTSSMVGSSAVYWSRGRGASVSDYSAQDLLGSFGQFVECVDHQPYRALKFHQPQRGLVASLQFEAGPA